MFINPKIAIEQGWISHPDCETLSDWESRSFISPNAIDFTLDTLNTVSVDNAFLLSEGGKVHRGGELCIPEPDKQSNLSFWNMQNTVYDGSSLMHVNVPEGIVSWLIPRSTLNRNGIFLMSGLYDSGFSGSVGFVLYNMGGYSKIAPHTRVGQIVFAESQNAKKYAGGYNTNPGQHWSEDK